MPLRPRGASQSDRARMRQTDDRPDPDDLLAQAHEAERAARRGHAEDLLRRVGRRRQDLRDAGAGRRRSASRASDVVIGVVETHGRADTAALVGATPVIPRRESTHRGRALPEFDLDARAGARARAGAGRRAGAFQRRRLAPSQALAGRGGAARQRHRRVDDDERAAPREPQRRRQRGGRRARAGRRCPTTCSTAPTTSCWSTCRPTNCCSG